MQSLPDNTQTWNQNEEVVMTDTNIQVTPAAVARLQQLKQEEQNEALRLRIFVTGGGCAGFQYGFTFDEMVAEDDAVVAIDSAEFLIDALSYQYLEGAMIDYEEGLQGARFVVTNPSASATCGCGASFAI